MDYKEVLEKAGFNLRDDGDSWRAKAFYRNGGNPTSLKISKKNGRFVDFSADQNGSFADLIYLATGQRIDEGEVQLDVFVPDDKLDFRNEVFDWENIPKLANYKFYLDKGIKKEVLQEFEGAVVQTGKMTRRFCFPIRNEIGRVIGLSGRLILDDPNRPKWKNCGYKNAWIFPLPSLNEIKKRGEVILVESIGDCLALYSAGIRNVLVLFGVKVSPKVKAKLIELGVNKVVIATNDDKENNNVGNLAAEKIKKNLKFMFSDVRIHLPTKNDFGVMDENETKNWYNLL